MADLPRYVWETPCLTYTEYVGDGWVGVCLYHKTRGDRRPHESAAQSDCTSHLMAVWANMQTASNQPTLL